MKERAEVAIPLSTFENAGSLAECRRIVDEAKRELAKRTGVSLENIFEDRDFDREDIRLRARV